MAFFLVYSIYTYRGKQARSLSLNYNVFFMSYTTYGLLCFKGELSGQRQFLAIESPLKMMKNAFYFTSKALFVLKIFMFLSCFFGRVTKRLD